MLRDPSRFVQVQHRDSNDARIPSEFAKAMKTGTDQDWLHNPQSAVEQVRLEDVRSSVNQIENITDCLWSYKTVLALAASGDADLSASLQALNVGEEQEEQITLYQRINSEGQEEDPVKEREMADVLPKERKIPPSYTEVTPTAGHDPAFHGRTPSTTRSHASRVEAASPPAAEVQSAVSDVLSEWESRQRVQGRLTAAWGEDLEMRAFKSGFVENHAAGHVTWFQEPIASRDTAKVDGVQARMKAVTVGDGATGKTCFYIAYTTNKFPEVYVPTVFDNYAVTVMVGEDPLTVGLWDTAGQEDYDRLRPLSYPETDVFIITYRCDSLDSLCNVENKWVQEIRHHGGDTRIMLVGLQEDVRRDPVTVERLADRGLRPTTYMQGCEVAKAIGADAFAECSAKTGLGLQDVFKTAILIGLGVFERAASDVRKAHGGRKGECMLM